MKKIFTKLMLWAVAATALVSCENNFEEQAPVAGLTQTVTLTAEKPTEVRTELIGGVPYWKAEDAIGVYTQTVKDADYYKFTNDATGDALTTSFTGTTAVANTLFVFYPYDSCNGISADGAKVLFPATQSPTATSFDGKADIMLAKPVTLDEEGKQLSGLEFARVGAIVKIVLKGDISSLAGQHISSLTMTAASSLVGRAYLDVEKQELGKLYDESKSNSVMATYPAASTQYEVNGKNATYVIVYPQVLEAGNTLTITATTEDYDIKKDITVPADGIDLVQGVVTTLNVSLAADHITKRETVEWVDNAYNLVPSTTNLNIGDKVVFVAAAYDKAMGTQNSNNRAAVTVTKNDNKTVGIDSDVTIFTVVEGNSEGTFAFQSSEGYICVASSEKNYLRQETTLTANSSWSVNIAEGIATVKAQGSYTHNWLRFNPTNNPPIFSCYATGQTDIAIYKLVGEYVPSAPAITLSIADVIVEHDETSGEATVIATNGDGWAIEATTEDTWVSNLAYSNGKITFTTEANNDEAARTATVTVTATKADYEDVTTTFTITQNAKSAEGDDAATWTLVTSASSLAAGDQIIIAAKDSNYAIGPDKGNNREAVAITKSGNTLVNPSNSVEIITLEAGTVTNTFAFKTSKNYYLYAASSSSNYLKSKESKDANGSWLITIESSGNATIKAQGTYTRNWLRKNSSSALFACYSSGQNDVVIYKLVGGNGGGSTPEPEPEPATPVLSINPTILNFDAAAGSKNIECTIDIEVSGQNVTATENVDWLTTSVSGKTVTITATENKATTTRTATVTIAYANAESKKVTVNQAAAENTGGGETTAKTYTLTIGTSSFNSTSYAANNNEKTSTATAADGSTMQVKWTSNQVMLQSSAMQWKKNEGYIYNSTDLGTITEITINSSAGSFTKYIGSSKQPTTNGSGGFFQIKVGNATGKTTSVVIKFTK